MKFWFCLGTAAELIKIFPIIDEAQKRNIDWYLLSTGQSGVNLWKQFDDFQLPHQRIIHLNDSTKDLSSSLMALSWFFKSFFKFKLSLQNKIKKTVGTVPSPTDFWFIHGDTLSTLLGSIYARRLKVPAVHIEAGMRSHHLLSPFPEEINRKIVSRLSQYHMPPDKNAQNNLLREGIRKHVFITHGNTVMDTLDVAIERFKPLDLPTEPYALANVHRFENLNSEARWNKIIETIILASQKIKIYFVLMPNTALKIEANPELKKKLELANITLLLRLPFSRFVHLMKCADFMLTDGGSNQQECFHLGIPCLILRDRTESIEGIGGCCILSQFKDEIIKDFLSDPKKFKNPTVHHLKRATDIVFEGLLGKIS